MYILTAPPCAQDHRVHIFTWDETANRVSVSAHSAGAYTATLLVIVNVMKGGRRAVHPPPTPARANLTLTMECTPVSSRYYSVYSLYSVTLCAGPRKPDLRAKDGGWEAWRSWPRRQAREGLQGWFFSKIDQFAQQTFFLFLENLKVPPGQIGSDREWNHLIGLEKNINRAIGFRFFNFSFKYLKRLQSSEPLHTKMLHIRLTGCTYTNRNLFRQTGLQKGGKVNNCSLDYARLVRKLPQFKPK